MFVSVCHSRIPIWPSLMIIWPTIKKSVCLYWASKNKTKPSIAHPHYLHPMVMIYTVSVPAPIIQFPKGPLTVSKQPKFPDRTG